VANYKLSGTGALAAAIDAVTDNRHRVPLREAVVTQLRDVMGESIDAAAFAEVGLALHRLIAALIADARNRRHEGK